MKSTNYEKFIDENGKIKLSREEKVLLLNAMLCAGLIAPDILEDYVQYKKMKEARKCLEQ